MTSEHLTDEILQQYADGALPRDKRRTAKRHLDACSRCQTILGSLERIDRTLRTMPREHAGEAFTRDVMLRLGIKPPTPLLFRVAESLAYLFGLVLVVGVTGTVYFLSGVINAKHIDHTRSVFGDVLGSAGGYWRDAGGAISLTIKTYLPFLFESATLRIGITTVLVLVVLALVDGYVRKHILSGR